MHRPDAPSVDNTRRRDKTGEMEPLTLTELGQRVAGRWPTIAVMAVIGLLGGATCHLVSATEYEAHAILRVDAADPAHVDMAAEVALASSRQVTNEALDALERPSLTIDALESATTTTALPDSRVLQVSFVAGSPATAARGADAVAQAYLAVREQDVDRRLAAKETASSTADLVDPARIPTTPVGLSAATTGVAGLSLGLLVAVPIAARPHRSGRRAARPESVSVK